MDFSERPSKKSKVSDEDNQIIKQYIKTAIISQVASELNKSLNQYLNDFEIPSNIQFSQEILSKMDIASSKNEYLLLCIKEQSMKHEKFHTTEINKMINDFTLQIKEDLLIKNS